MKRNKSEKWIWCLVFGVDLYGFCTKVFNLDEAL